jgi:hypothetical protein
MKRVTTTSCEDHAFYIWSRRILFIILNFQAKFIEKFETYFIFTNLCIIIKHVMEKVRAHFGIFGNFGRIEKNLRA